MRKFSLIFFLLTSFCFSLLAQQENMSEGFEVFNTATKLPEGWIAYTKEGTRPFTVVKDSKYGVPHARTEKCYVSSTSNPPRYDDTKVRRDNWLVSPKLKYTAGASLSLWAKSKDAPGNLSVPEEDPSSRFAIYLSKTETAVADFTVELLEAVQVPNSYTEYAVDLSNPEFGLTAGDEVYIAIRVVDEVDLSTNPNTNRILYIDDIEFGVPVTNPIVELSGAAWAAQTMVGESVSSGNVFDLKNVGGGQLTVTSVTSLDGTPFTTTFSKDAVSLSRNQTYSFSFNYSSDSPISITKDFVIETTGGSVTVSLSGTTEPLPVPLNEINEDFGDGLPSNWLTIDGNSDKNCWTIKNGAPVLELNAAVQNDWLVLPRVKIRDGQVLSFDYKCSLSDKGVINIKASKQGRAIGKFSITLAENLVVPHSPVDFITKQIDLAGSSLVDGDEVFIAIQCVSDPVGGIFPGKLTIDNVKVVAPSREAEIVSCTVPGQVASVVNAEAGTVDITVPSTSGITAVEPVFVLSPGAAISPSGVQDFSQGAVAYTVTAEAGNTRVWQVSVVHEVVLSDAAAVTGFSIEGVSAAAVISAEASTVSLTVPTSVDLSKVSPVVTVSDKASVVPASGAEQDFSQGAVAYTVTAEAGNTRVWQVSVVHEAVLSDAAEVTGFSIEGVSAAAVISVETSTVSLTVPTSVDLSKVSPVVTVSDKASVVPASGVEQDFSQGAVPYTVTAEAGNTRVWQVSVVHEVVLSDAAAVTGFSIEGVSATAVISAEASTVSLTVPASVDLSKVSPVVTVSAKASVIPASGAEQDFSQGAVAYTVTSEAGNTRVWQVSVVHEVVLSDAAEVTGFSIEGVSAAAVISAEASTVSLTVPASVDLTKVSPVVTVSEGASVVPASGVEQDFSQGAVAYTVTAEAGNTRVWQVSVVHEEQSVEGIFEGFEGGELPATWRMVDADNDGKAWFVIKYMPFEGNYIIKTKRNKNQNNDWLIAPRVKVRENDVLSFMYRSSAVNYKESFNVKVSKNGVNVDSDFTITLASVVDASADVGFTKFEYRLCDNDNIAAGDEVYIAIQVVSADKGELHVDNFSVAPPATNPKLLMQGNHWRSVVEVNQKATSPEVFAFANILAGELTVLSFELPQGFTTSLNPSAVSLKKDEVYSFTISFEPEAAGDYSGSMVIKTNGGDAVIDLKGYAYASGLYHEGFESEAAINAWEVIDADADGLGWFPYQNDEYAPDLAHSGMGCVVSESAKLSGGPATPNNWLVSPKVVVSSGSSLTFWIGAVSDISFREHYSVLLSTKGKGLDNFDVVLIDNEELASHAWTKRSIDLSAYANKSVYIAFVHHKVSDQSQILIDDVVLPAKYVATNPDLTVLLKQQDYTICPLSQAVYNFDAKVKNQGAALTEAASLAFTVEGTSYKELLSIPVPLAASSEVVLAVSNGFTPKAKGEYTVRVEAAIANDENPADNVITSTFTVCDSVLARDKGIFTNFVGLGPKNGGVVGQKFTVVVKDTLTSISFYRVAASAELTVSASVFGFDTKPTKEIARTANVTIPAEFEGWVTIPLAKPLVLEPNAYFVGLNESAEGNLGLAVDQGIFHPQSCFIQFMGEWIAADELEEAMQMVLLLRANFAPKQIVSSDFYNKLNVSVYPNPAKGWINIDGMSGATATLYSLSGTVCMSVSIESDTQKVNIEQLQPGVYVLRIAKQGLYSSIKLVVTR
ncbi:MAG: choice-of-anchor J domain-containing protein [Bacteroidales bacterium]|nr:choice-of-anchor J domain-containing protein [Bacteroidales bacterium]MBN2748732.1 choice-of-anchor J domain-containing protein [Bacteroidales bacterium]